MLLLDILAIDLLVLIFSDAFKFIKRMQGLAEHSPTWQSHHHGPISTSKSLLCSLPCILKKSLTEIFNWPFSIQMDGFQEFETRRKMKFDKQIDSNVIISSKGLDEGVDLWYQYCCNFCKSFHSILLILFLYPYFLSWVFLKRKLLPYYYTVVQ